MSAPILLVPGWRNSGPGHWQSLWEEQLRDTRRVEMPNWDFPRKAEWVEALDEALAASWQASQTPPVLVGHSLGCLAIVHWALNAERPIKAALLVAPSDVARKGGPEELRSFAPIPMRNLPFPSRVVIAEDDPYTTVGAAKAMATAWGSALTLLPRGGHLNPASGYGDWPAGEALLQEWLR